MALDDSLSLEQRIRRIEDHIEIAQLANRYCVAVDDKNWDELLTMYATDAEIADQVGRQAVINSIRAVRETFGRTVHSTHGSIVDILDESAATGTVTAHAELDIAGQLVVCHIRYLDRYAKESGRWLFFRRDLRFLYVVPWSDYGEALAASHPVRWPGAEPVVAGF